MIGITVKDDKFDAVVQSLAGELERPRGLAAVLARETYNLLRKHFLRKQTDEPNKLGGKRTNFWRAAANSVQVPLIAEDGLVIRVSINHPAMAQKYFGGVITAKRGKSLTIPVSAEAHGRTASTLEHELNIDLFLVPREFGRGLLAAAMADTSIKVHYVLRRSVNQKKDETALPPRDQMLRALLARGRAYVKRLTQGSKNT